MSLRRSFPIALALFLLPAGQAVLAREVTLQERLRAQAAIERVDWSHRIWPAENDTPKPRLEAVLSRAQIRARVVDSLRKSNALAAIWNRPITAALLQEEMRRMALESQAPGVLRELFAALGDDPSLIAETLVRPTLADRLIREAYAGDARPDFRGRSFEEWWAQAASHTSGEIVPVSGAIEAVTIPSDPACVEDTWRAIPPGPVPWAGHTAVWTGAEMIVWGGYRDYSPAYGGRYNPATNSWTTIAELDPAMTRFVHTAIWTGREMIVWGGHEHGVPYPGGYLNTGGRYDPTTDTWQPTSVDLAPMAREAHTATWNGKEMFVWGGDTGFATVNDGGRYNPVTDTWTGISLDDAPAGRAFHSAVWTGTDLIVWGGMSSSNGHSYMPTRTGGRYRPATNTWTPTRMGSVDQAPSARSRHTAVWTGARMIVWGGSGGPYLNTGAMYDPVTDTWTPTSLGGALPEGREGHSVVWTGHEMIVWGGHQGGQPFNAAGARYDPGLGTWLPMAQLSALMPREGTSAVWTGNEMLTWRGFGGTTVGYSGRYCAPVCHAATTLYRDYDGDGYGNAADSITSCPLPGYADNADDCDDMDGRVSPGDAEVCNGADDNCNGEPDEGLGTTSCGLGVCRRTVTACVDGVPSVCSPGLPAPDVCNGLDDDCNGVVDDGDADGDGTTDCLDCQPANPGIPPAAAETCNGLDDDCDAIPDDVGGALDLDGDGVSGACDNCPAVANSDQSDQDRDGIGDACDVCLTLPNAPTDSDGDGTPDACDLCPAYPYPTTDADGDGAGAGCDNCPSAANPTPADSIYAGSDDPCLRYPVAWTALNDDGDADLLGDGCDNCTTLPNVDQSDFDSDGEGDACDLNDGWLMIWVTRPDQVDWDSEATFFLYDVYRGDLDVLRATGDSAQDPETVALAGRFCGQVDAFLLDDPPPPGKGVFYLVGVWTASGYEGIGDDSAGNPRRPVHACP